MKPNPLSADGMTHFLLSSLEKIVDWAKQKCRIQARIEEPPYFSEREIWWARIGENVGSEQNGKGTHYARPILILKKFNKGLLLALPLTTRDREGPYYFKLSDFTNHPTARVVLSQVRTLSSKRLESKLRTIRAEEFGRIRRAVKDML